MALRHEGFVWHQRSYGKDEHHWTPCNSTGCTRWAFHKQSAPLVTKCCTICTGIGSQHSKKCKYRQRSSYYAMGCARAAASAPAGEGSPGEGPPGEALGTDTTSSAPTPPPPAPTATATTANAERSKAKKARNRANKAARTSATGGGNSGGNGGAGANNGYLQTQQAHQQQRGGKGAGRGGGKDSQGCKGHGGKQRWPVSYTTQGQGNGKGKGKSAQAPVPQADGQAPCTSTSTMQLGPITMQKDFQSQVCWMHWPSSLHPHQILWVTSTKTQPSGCCERKPSLIMAEARRAKTVRVAKVLSDTAQGGGQQPRVRMPRRGLAITEDEVRDEYAFRRASVSDLC